MSPTDTLTPNSWLHKYYERGFRLVFYPTKLKGPVGPEGKTWTQKIYTLEDYAEGQNVGVVLGHEVQPGRFLVDVDFDWPDGLSMARRLLPSTAFGFGRQSRAITHAFYTSPQPLRSRAFKDVDGKGFVELRGTKDDGTLGLQTMVPPSIHPSEETLILRSDGELTHSDNLERRITLYAIACMMLHHLGHRGLLHDVRLALSGFLLKCNLTEEEVTAVGEAIAEATGNSVSDVAVAVHSTASRLKRGERVQGYTALKEAIGDVGLKVCSRIREWLGESEFVTDEEGRIKKDSQENIAMAIEKMGMELSYDAFRRQPLMKLTDDSPFNSIHKYATGRSLAFNDDAAVDAWLYVDRNYHFKPSKDFFYDVSMSLARQNPFHPVRIYLDSLKWDSEPRLAKWLVTFAGAADTDFVQAVSTIVLVAAVRRIREPGCKFDEMLILESQQGLQKSTALSIMAYEESWFTDDLPLDVDAKELIERTTGKWIIEAAEMSGMRPALMEHLKAMLSRRVDGPVRKAYGRLSDEEPRQFIIVGSTNKHSYLTDSTGNRRFWPVRVGFFDLKGLRENRDQLWAEAAQLESEGYSIRLPEELWEHAGLQQERRRAEDPWEDRIGNNFNDEYQRLAPDQIWELIGIPTERRDERGQRRITEIMQRLGFRRMTVMVEGKIVKGWGRGAGQRDPVRSLLDEPRGDSEDL